MAHRERERERPGLRVLTRGLAGVEPLWAALHTVGGRIGGMGRQDEVVGGREGLPSDMTLSNETGSNT